MASFGTYRTHSMFVYPVVHASPMSVSAEVSPGSETHRVLRIPAQELEFLMFSLPISLARKP